MTQTWIALSVVVGIVLFLDLVTTHLRRCARHMSNSPEPTSTETEGADRTDEAVALDHN